MTNPALDLFGELPDPSSAHESSTAGDTDASVAGPPIAAAREVAPGESLRVVMLASDWRQGVILPPALALEVTPIHGGFATPADGRWPDDHWYIVVSQDCDIVHGNLVAEPVVEVMVATRIDVCAPKHVHLRTPRLLHATLSGENGDLVPVAFDITQRGFLHRDLLPAARPLAGLRAGAGTVTEFAAMLARRYMRASRPEMFDRRLKPALSRIEDLLDRGAQDGSLLDVLFRIDPMGECATGEPYVVAVYAVLQDAFDRLDKCSTQPAVDALRQGLRDALRRCTDVEVEIVHVVGRREIDLALRDGLRSLEIVWPRFEADASDDDA